MEIIIQYPCGYLTNSNANLYNLSVFPSKYDWLSLRILDPPKEGFEPV